MDRELGWNDEIENDGDGFNLLPEGEYSFTVKGFERARHAGSDKLPPCNKAVISLEFDAGEHGTATFKENLFLHSKTEGLLCAFFRAIGQRKSGEKMTMDWNSVIGSTGRAKVGVRKYKYQGEDREVNQVKCWIDAPAEPSTTAGPAAEEEIAF